MKHNKLKNTGILFEILCKKITHETLNPNIPQNSMRIIKKHFKQNSLLLNELKLYQQLSQIEKNVDPVELSDLIIKTRKQFDSKKLNEEKYSLVKSIKKVYNLNEFYDTRVSNYKLMASIYNLFEYNAASNPTKYLQNKKYLIETLTGTEKVNQEDEIKTMLMKEDRDVRRIGFKIIVERFNQKYRKLNDRQKLLLSKYINENIMTDDFKNYVIKECNWIGKKLNLKMKLVKDPIQKIKLTEIHNLLDKIVTSNIIKEEHLSSMLKYYELIEELK